MPKKAKPKTKKKVFEKDTNIETGFSTLQETDHSTPIRGRDGVPPDVWQDQGQVAEGTAKSDLPYGRPTDDLHPDAVQVRGTRPPGAPAKTPTSKLGTKKRKRAA
jgi:hypothetical protein